MYIYMCIYIYTHIHIYIYMYIYRERERYTHYTHICCSTPYPTSAGAPWSSHPKRCFAYLKCSSMYYYTT